MVVRMTKKLTFFHFAILLLIYVDIVSGPVSFLRGKKGNTKDAKAKPLKHTRLEMPEKVNPDGKKQNEAFMALVTYPLGFMNTDTQQVPFLEKFMVQYHEFKKDHMTYPNSLPEIYNDNDPWCRDLLEEPVLRDNHIFYQPLTMVLTRLVKKYVHFDYFTKEPEVHDVLQCRVTIRRRNVKIYFSALGKSNHEDLKYYFVLTGYKPNDDSQLVVLMRTKFHDDTEVQDNSDGDDNFVDNPYMHDFTQGGQIKLNVKPSRLKNSRYRLFGKYAEAAFISTYYGFWNPNINPYALYNFLETILALSKGYEVARRKLKSKAVRQEGPFICKSHIDNSRLFRTYGIQFDDENAAQITTTKQSISSFIRGIPDQNFRFLKCPVKGSMSGFVLHHPIYFKEGSKFGRYDLFWYIPSKGKYRGKEVLLLLAPSQLTQQQESDSQEIVEHT